MHALKLTAAAVGVTFAGTALAQDVDRTGWPDSFTVASASQGGVYFIYGNGWANLVGETLGISGGGEVSDGPVQNAALVHTGDTEFGMVTMGPAYDAWIGNSPLAPGVPMDKLRALFPMYQTSFMIIALESSGIDSVADLDGKTVGVGPAGGTPGTYFPLFFETLGVDVEVQFGGADDLAGQVQDGLIDAFAFAAGLPIPAFSQLEAQLPVNIFAFTPEEQAALLEAYPSVSAFAIPADVYTTTEADLPSVAMWNFAVANADVPDTLAYEAARIVMENNDRMVQIHSAAKETLPENYGNNNFLPWHPGAVRWFEENGFDIREDLGG
jgi:hypothetical protein